MLSVSDILLSRLKQQYAYVVVSVCAFCMQFAGQVLAITCLPGPCAACDLFLSSTYKKSTLLTASEAAGQVACPVLRLMHTHRSSNFLPARLYTSNSAHCTPHVSCEQMRLQWGRATVLH